MAIWLAATAALIAAFALVGGELQRGNASFDALLTRGCALVLGACAVWFWLATTVVLAGAARGARTSIPGCPRFLQRTLLVACGVALLAPAAPASAERDPAPAAPQALAGLPLPDRPEIRGPGSARPSAVTTVVVRPGDSLWTIAEGSLPPGAGPAAIDARWREIWVANRRVIGPDPDLIHPGAELRLTREES